MLTLSSLLRALSTSWRRRSPPALPTWSWSSSFFHTTWWANGNARRSSVITSAASSTVAVQMHFGDSNLYPSPGKWWSTRADQGKRQIWSSFRKPSTSSGIHSSTLKNPPTGSISIVHWTISIPIRRRHLDTVPQMAMAVVKLNQKGDISEGVSDTIQYFLDRLYINRSGQRIACSPLHERAISGSQSTCWSLTSMLCKDKALLSRAWSVLLVI